MEVGVDIGVAARGGDGQHAAPALQLPAARRPRRPHGQPFSFALTLCRDRSHDDYYFNNPERITGDPPPQPYLDLRARADHPARRRRRVPAPRIPRACPSDRHERARALSIHGTSGRRERLAPTYREHVARGCNDATSCRPRSYGASAAHTALSRRATSTRSSDGLRNELMTSDRRRSSTAPTTSKTELSERLANAGVLPMFGFPTRVRHALLQGRPDSREQEEALTVSDRPLDMAISSFSPGRRDHSRTSRSTLRRVRRLRDPPRQALPHRPARERA